MREEYTLFEDINFDIGIEHLLGSLFEHACRSLVPSVGSADVVANSALAVACRIVFAEYIEFAVGTRAEESNTCCAATHCYTVAILNTAIAVGSSHKYVGNTCVGSCGIEHPESCVVVAPVGEIYFSVANGDTQRRRAVA